VSCQAAVDRVREHSSAPVVRIIDVPDDLMGATLVETDTPIALAVEFEMRVMQAIERAYLRQRPRHTYGVFNTSDAARAFELHSGPAPE
jgi:hypothetical protein